jgi:hypothetical protein
MKSKCIAVLCALVLAAVGGCSADHSAEGPAAGAGADPASRAFIDPVTGEMRAPTAAELAAARSSEPADPALRQQAPSPKGTRLPDGTIMYDMRDQPQVEEKVCVQADGNLGPCTAK